MTNISEQRISELLQMEQDLQYVLANLKVIVEALGIDINKLNEISIASLTSMLPGVMLKVTTGAIKRDLKANNVDVSKLVEVVKKYNHLLPNK